MGTILENTTQVFADGDQITSTNLNNLLSEATFKSTAVDQSSVTLSSGKIALPSTIPTRTFTSPTLNSPTVEGTFTVNASALGGTGIVIESEGIASNDNDTSLPTSAAVKDYVDTQLTAEDLDFAGDTGTGAVDLDSQTLTIAGTANKVETSASGQTLTISLPSTVNISTLEAGSVITTSIKARIDNNGSISIRGGATAGGRIDLDGDTIGGLSTYYGLRHVFKNVAGSSTYAEISSSGVVTNTVSEYGVGSGVTVDSLLIKDGGFTAAGTSTFAGQTISDLGTVTTANIDGGSIDGTTVGASSASTGAFTTLTASDDVNFDSGTLFVDASADRVGIGTTSPAKKLHISSDANGQTTADIPGIRIENTDTTAVTTDVVGEIEFFSKDASEADKISGFIKNVAEDAGTKYALTLGSKATGSNATERMRIDADGNVGIGTTSPDAKLSISDGNIGIDGNGSAQQFFGAGGNVAGTNTSGGVLTVLGHAPNAVGDLSTPPYDGSNFVGAAGLMARGFSESGQYRGSLEFFTKTASAANATSRMLISHDGDVGIGTSSPGQKLEVNGGNIEIDSTGAVDSRIIFSRGGTNLAWMGIPNWDEDALYIYGPDAGGTTTDQVFSYTQDTLKLKTNGSDALTIDSSQNVGIGTTSPNQTLDVNGTFVASGANSYFGVSDTTGSMLHIFGSGTGSNEGGEIRIYTAADHDTTYDYYFLDAYQDDLRIGRAGGTDITLTSSGDVNFDSGTLFVDASTNCVGLGITSAINTQIGGNPRLGAYDASGARIGIWGNGSRWWYLHGEDTNAFQIGYRGSGNTTDNDVITALTSGNVGIGETSPDALLHVGTGSIYQNKTGTGTFPGLSDTTSHGFMAESQGSNGSSIHVSRTDSAAGNFSRQGTGDVLVFRNTSGSVTEAGSVEITGASSVAYRTSSDYRLKENVVDVTDGIDRVKQLNPVRFNFIGEDPVVDGFLAHEVQDVIPEAISGTKDGMKDEEYEVSPAVYEDVVHPAVEATYDEEGNELTPAVEEWTESVLVSEAVRDTRSVPDYQGIDQSKLVPLLTAALQEAVAKIEALEARVQTLEG